MFGKVICVVAISTTGVEAQLIGALKAAFGYDKTTQPTAADMDKLITPEIVQSKQADALKLLTESQKIAASTTAPPAEKTAAATVVKELEKTCTEAGLGASCQEGADDDTASKSKAGASDPNSGTHKFASAAAMMLAAVSSLFL